MVSSDYKQLTRKELEMLALTLTGKEWDGYSLASKENYFKSMELKTDVRGIINTMYNKLRVGDIEEYTKQGIDVKKLYQLAGIDIPGVVEEELKTHNTKKPVKRTPKEINIMASEPLKKEPGSKGLLDRLKRYVGKK